MMKMPHWPIPLGNRPIDFDLDRITELLKRLGNPHHRIPPVIHVAGTNGKGSTLAFLKAIFEAAGYRVHRYTSPHLVRFNERIVLAGSEISDEMLYEMAETCRIAAKDDIPVTFFEGTTAMAYLAFAKVPADVLLLETGMGGRLDATNVIDRPLVSVISSVSYDHMEYLGPTIECIMREKAGILKKDVPCVVSYQFPEGMRTVEEEAVNVGAPLFRYGHEWNVERLPDDRWYYAETEGKLLLPQPSLLGPHQYINAGNAVAAVQCAEGFAISDEAIAEGIRTATWPARFEAITSGALKKLLPEGWELWLDGAHNEAGAELIAYMAEEWKDRPLYCILGMTKGRDIKKFLKQFSHRITHLCGMRVESEPSAYPAERVALEAHEMGIKATAAESVEHAISTLTTLYKDAPGRIIVCGSLYLAGDITLYNEAA
ncbi:MAG: folylpolyglutamate synthase [Rickettsiales bacterium]|jgi:dihydrofolate synthase/folylpolyglutamate synthase|nr:folylpolyglutamate synthase [Rickettsiales bacterium]